MRKASEAAIASVQAAVDIDTLVTKIEVLMYEEALMEHEYDVLRLQVITELKNRALDADWQRKAADDAMAAALDTMKIA